MRNSRAIDAVALAGLSAALLVILFSFWHWPPPFDKPLHAAIGRALAQEALRVRGPTGQVLLLTRDTETFSQPALDILCQKLQAELRAAGAPITTTLWLQTDPIRPVEVPSGDFFELMRRAPARSVIISLLGPPLLTAEQRHRLGSVRPKIVAFCSGSMAENLEMKQLFQAGLLHAAVVSRTPESLNASAGSARFEQLYTIVRAPEEQPAAADTGP